MRQDPSGAQALLTAAGLSPEACAARSAHRSREPVHRRATRHQVREFLRGSFAPMLRAAFNAALQAASPDPFEFLAQWFWTHSEAAAQPSSTKPRELSVGHRRREQLDEVTRVLGVVELPLPHARLAEDGLPRQRRLLEVDARRRVGQPRPWTSRRCGRNTRTFSSRTRRRWRARRRRGRPEP